MKRKVSNPLALAVLALLCERPMHPYEMAFVMRERHQHEAIKLNYGSLYTTVSALSREGLIVAEATTREGRRPNRTIYALTPPGRQEFVAWVRDLLRLPAKEYRQFAAGLTFVAALPAEDAVHLLQERVDRLDDQLEEARFALRALHERGLPRVVLIEHEYDLALLEAEAEWVRKVVHDARSGSLSWPRIRTADGTPDWDGTWTSAGTDAAEASPDESE